jgi:hypothetical protein
MKSQLSASLENGRLRYGPYESQPDERHGAFRIQGPCGCELVIMSSGTDSKFGWEHVSVSINRRMPNWTEMCFVKDLFWDEEEAVMQLHPPKSTYVNHHPYCLHLWKSLEEPIPLPPSTLV